MALRDLTKMGTEYNKIIKVDWNVFEFSLKPVGIFSLIFFPFILIIIGIIEILIIPYTIIEYFKLREVVYVKVQDSEGERT